MGFAKLATLVGMDGYRSHSLFMDRVRLDRRGVRSRDVLRNTAQLYPILAPSVAAKLVQKQAMSQIGTACEGGKIDTMVVWLDAVR